MIPSAALASVALPGARAELRHLPLEPLGDGEAWLRVLASGICGTDVRLYAEGIPEPTVLGHHVVGELESGRRVVLEEYLPCGDCPMCDGEWYRLCPATDLWTGGRRIGTIPHGLYGGNAEYLRLPSNAVLHPVPPDLPVAAAVWTLPLANALDWTLGAGALRPGETVVIIGPGYHGLSAVAAARHGGAGAITVAGLPRDAARLQLARALGADTVTDPAALPTADVVIDAAGAEPADRWLNLLNPRGRLVLTTPSGTATVDTAQLTRGMFSIHAVRGRAPRWVRTAIELLAAGTAGVHPIPTETIGLAETGAMLARLSRGEGPATPHVVVLPHH